ncbi:MAG: PD40 domain-containing protein [Bacteroidales bacterium]|nr:PD40 domain-containing protein [Bacteroidales bacterium]
MRRLIYLMLLLCLPLFAVGQGSSVMIKSGDEATYRKALGEYEHRHYREAAQLMRHVAGRNPKAADPQFWLGMTAVKDGFNVTAIRRYFGRCIELEPDYANPLAHYYMALIHYTDDRYDDAVKELNKYFALANGSQDKAVNAVYEEASNYLYWSQFLAEAVLNAAPFDPQRVEGVSSIKYNEMLPFLTVDGQTFYYLREMPASTERTFYARELERKQWYLYSSKRLNDTAFSKGVELPAPFNSGDPEGGVSVTADGSELYYSIIRNSGGYANSDIYCARKDKSTGRWTVENCGPQVNGDRSWESQPTISADGKTLLFASNRKGGQGGIDLWRCHKLKNGDWSRAENLGSNINTDGNEKAPFLAADGRTLYFLSDGWQGFGGYDVYFANLSDSYGNRPTNLGLPINTEADELSFGVSADGRKAYFSGRLEGSRSSDILMFDLYPAARPEPMRLCRMKMATPKGERDTVLMLSEQYVNVVTLTEEGMLPVIRCGKAKELNGKRVVLNDSIAAIDLLDKQVVDALSAWLVEHPRVHLAVECPKQADAQAAVARLREKGLRAERLTARGGTDIATSQIRLKTE